MATISKSVTVADGGTYSIMLNAIPTGSTVTPVNDIQTWLHCADIWDKNYTTLDEVLADAPTLQALIASNNAADYMARSTEWASDSNIGLVPIMTSNTAPYGEAFYSNGDSSYPAYKAFDGDSASYASFNNQVDEYIGYEFPSAIVATSLFISGDASSGTDFYIEGADSKTGTYTVLESFKGIEAAKTVNFTNATAYKSYRLRIKTKAESWNKFTVYTLQFYPKAGIPTNQNAMSYIGANNYCAKKLLSNTTWCESILNSAYWESVINAKIPTMTSNTAPSGVASSSGAYTGAYEPYKAFDGQAIRTYGWCPTGGRGSKWLQYKFTKKNIIKKMYFSTHGSSVTITKIQGSNDGNTFTDIPNTGITVSNDNSATAFIIANNTEYMYYRAYVNGYNIDNWYGMKMQLYARQDV